LLTASTLRETLYAIDATADLLEELQFSLGEGACMDAARTGWPVLVPDPNDLTDTSRWPVYTTAVTEQAGVGAIFALPMQRATINLGVLVLYRYKAGSLARAQLLDAMAAADTAALMLLGLRTDPDPTRTRAACRAGTGRGRAGRRSTRPPAWCCPSSASPRPTPSPAPRPRLHRATPPGRGRRRRRARRLRFTE
jgi:hypothetical protein